MGYVVWFSTATGDPVRTTHRDFSDGELNLAEDCFNECLDTFRKRCEDYGSFSLHNGENKKRAVGSVWGNSYVVELTRTE